MCVVRSISIPQTVHDVAGRLLRPFGFSVVTLLVTASLAIADGGYRITIGDEILVRFSGGEEAAARVDPNGDLSLPGVGRIQVVGLTLDEAEARADEAAREANIYVEPAASLTLQGMAPVLVSGSVRNPGAVDFHSALNVGAAVGLAGGFTLASMDATQRALMVNDIEADRARLDVEHAALLIRLARFEAQADGRDRIDAAMNEVAENEEVEDALRIEARILREEAEIATELTRLWREGVVEAEEQIALLEDRIEGQERVAELQAEERDTVKSLVDRGLRPANELQRFERLITEANARIIEFKVALSAARDRRVDLSAEIVRLRGARLEQAMEGVRVTQDAIRANRISEDAQRRKLLLVNDLGGLVDPSFFDMKIVRGGQTIGAAASTPLRPGDLLMVSLVPEAPS